MVKAGHRMTGHSGIDADPPIERLVTLDSLFLSRAASDEPAENVSHRRWWTSKLRRRSCGVVLQPQSELLETRLVLSALSLTDSAVDFADAPIAGAAAIAEPTAEPAGHLPHTASDSSTIDSSRITVLAPSGVIADATPDFSWTADETAALYELLVSEADGDEVLHRTDLIDAHFTSATDLSDGEYEFQVRSADATDRLTPWTLPVAFTIDAAVDSDVDAVPNDDVVATETTEPGLTFQPVQQDSADGVFRTGSVELDSFLRQLNESDALPTTPSSRSRGTGFRSWLSDSEREAVNQWLFSFPATPFVDVPRIAANQSDSSALGDSDTDVKDGTQAEIVPVDGSEESAPAADANKAPLRTADHTDADVRSNDQPDRREQPVPSPVRRASDPKTRSKTKGTETRRRPVPPADRAIRPGKVIRTNAARTNPRQAAAADSATEETAPSAAPTN